MKEKNIILIPAYEPEDKLINLVEGLSKEKFEIVIVDDGSGPEYKNIFNDWYHSFPKTYYSKKHENTPLFPLHSKATLDHTLTWLYNIISQ